MQASNSPADEIAGMLLGLQQRLDALRCAGCAGCAGSGPHTHACLEDLHRYLIEELTPALHAVHLRIRPVLRRYGGVDDPRAASQRAALLRLSEQVAVLRAQHAATGAVTADLDRVLERLCALAAAYLASERAVLPALLRRLPAEESMRVVRNARRTAAAAAAAPRPDLEPAAL